MTYAATHHIGYDTTTQRAKTKAIAPTAKRVHKLDATPKRRKRDQKGQATARTAAHAANGFLKASFLPKLAQPQTILASKETAQTERDFYQSLSRLAEHYGIEPMQTAAFGYPYNIALALWDIEQQLNGKVRSWQEIKLLQDSKKTYLASEERYNTGSTLYYIPIVPLYRLLKNPKRKTAAQLLLSVCSYLYHVAGIPYYRQEDSFLYWQYEMLEEWVVTDNYDEDTENQISELTEAKWVGGRMEQKIYNHANLRVFKQRLDRFKSSDTLDEDCLKLAREAFALYEKYPRESVFRNAQIGGDAPQDDEDADYIVSMEKYISFCAHAKGWLSDNLIECVNTNLQEYSTVEEPAIIKRFDGSDITGNNLDFENRLFGLIDELIYLLNNL